MEHLKAWIIPFGVVSYFLIRSIYRLYFHPLKQIPGPRLAAITHLYEFYFDAIKSGQYIWEVERLHERYGPIVRINPREIHIKDPYYFDEIYSSRKTEKDPYFVNVYTLPQASIATINHEHHRYRRGLLNSFFSKRSVVNVENLVQEKVDKVSGRFEQAHREGSVVPLDETFAGLTTDVITHYTYGKSFDILEDKHLKNDFREAVTGATSVGHFTRFFPILVPLLEITPAWLIKKVNPKAAGLLDTKDKVAQQSIATLRRNGADHSKGSMRTIFDALSDPSLPPKEKTFMRLRDEGVIVLGAGTETTARVLTMGTFYLYRDKVVLLKLRDELRRLMPTHSSKASWTELEQLPYMNAVVNESLRLAHPVTGRLQRVSPEEALVYKNHVIPPGTPVSQSSYFVHTDPTVFPDPWKFEPERWIRAEERGERLTKFLVPFTKGTRICLGMNLAYSELYLTFAAMVRRFDLEIHDTTPDDVRITRDMVTGMPDAVALQVKAKITGIVKD